MGNHITQRGGAQSKGRRSGVSVNVSFVFAVWLPWCRYWFQDPDLVEKVSLPTKKKGGKKGGGSKDQGWSNVSHPRMKATGGKKKGGGGGGGFAGLSVDD